MYSRLTVCVHGVLVAAFLPGCSGSTLGPLELDYSRSRVGAVAAGSRPGAEGASGPQAFAGGVQPESAEPAALTESSTPDEYIRYALHHNPEVEASYQRWRASAERVPQVAALPDPRLTVGFFLDEVETRVGAQQAKIGIQQSFPWPGLLEDRADAATRGAKAAWWDFESSRLRVTELVVEAMHELAYLDASIKINHRMLELILSFEEIARSRYATGTGTHAELMRAQLELGQAEDRLEQLRGMRPSIVAALNSVLNREGSATVPVIEELPGRVVAEDAVRLVELAEQSSPRLKRIDEQVAKQERLTRVARAEGMPDFTVGLEYIVTDEAAGVGGGSSISESGDDPVFLSLGLTLPLWRDKYRAGVRESIARRLAATSDRADASNQISAAIHAAWYVHTDAHRRVNLYEHTLIPKAEESLRSSLEGYRAGQADFLDLLDSERALLDFSVAQERARAQRGKALATLRRLVGETIPTEPTSPAGPESTEARADIKTEAAEGDDS